METHQSFKQPLPNQYNTSSDIYRSGEGSKKANNDDKGSKKSQNEDISPFKTTFQDNQSLPLNSRNSPKPGQRDDSGSNERPPLGGSDQELPFHVQAYKGFLSKQNRKVKTIGKGVKDPKETPDDIKLEIQSSFNRDGTYYNSRGFDNLPVTKNQVVGNVDFHQRKRLSPKQQDSEAETFQVKSQKTSSGFIKPPSRHTGLESMYSGGQRIGSIKAISQSMDRKPAQNDQLDHFIKIQKKNINKQDHLSQKRSHQSRKNRFTQSQERRKLPPSGVQLINVDDVVRHMKEQQNYENLTKFKLESGESSYQKPMDQKYISKFRPYNSQLASIGGRGEEQQNVKTVISHLLNAKPDHGFHHKVTSIVMDTNQNSVPKQQTFIKPFNSPMPHSVFNFEINEFLYKTNQEEGENNSPKTSSAIFLPVSGVPTSKLGSGGTNSQNPSQNYSQLGSKMAIFSFQKQPEEIKSKLQMTEDIAKQKLIEGQLLMVAQMKVKQVQQTQKKKQGGNDERKNLKVQLTQEIKKLKDDLKHTEESGDYVAQGQRGSIFDHNHLKHQTFQTRRPVKLSNHSIATVRINNGTPSPLPDFVKNINFYQEVNLTKESPAENNFLQLKRPPKVPSQVQETKSSIMSPSDLLVAPKYISQSSENPRLEEQSEIRSILNLSNQNNAEHMPINSSDLYSQVESLKNAASLKNKRRENSNQMFQQLPIQNKQLQVSQELNKIPPISSDNPFQSPLIVKNSNVSFRQSVFQTSQIINQSSTTARHDSSIISNSQDIDTRLSSNFNMNTSRMFGQRELDRFIEKNKQAFHNQSIQGNLDNDKGQGSGSMFSNEDLEDWRNNVMSDQMYFLAAKDKKSLQRHQEKLREQHKDILPKINSRTVRKAIKEQPQTSPKASKSVPRFKPSSIKQISTKNSPVRQARADDENIQGAVRYAYQEKRALRNSQVTIPKLLFEQVDPQAQKSGASQPVFQNQQKIVRNAQVSRSNNNSNPKVELDKSVTENSVSTNLLLENLNRIQHAKNKLSYFTQAQNEQNIAMSLNQPSKNKRKPDDGTEFDKEFKEAMNEIQSSYRISMRTNTSLNKGINNTQRISVPRQKSDVFRLDVCETAIFCIENVKNKPQPINFNFTGLRGEVLAFISTLDTPTEKNYHSMIEGQSSFSFSNAQEQVELYRDSMKSGEATVKDDLNVVPRECFSKSHSLSKVALPRFKMGKIYCAIETTQASQSAWLTVTYGLGKDNRKSQMETMDMEGSNTNNDSNRNSAEIQKIPQSRVSPIGIKAKEDEVQQLFMVFRKLIGTPFEKNESCLSRHAKIHREMDKLVDDSPQARKYLKQTDMLAKQSKEDRLQMILDQTNFVDFNVFNCEHFVENEVTRVINNMYTRGVRSYRNSHEKVRQLEEWREKSHDFTNRNLHRQLFNFIMDKKTTQQRKKEIQLLFYSCSIKKLQVVVQLWQIFKKKRDQKNKEIRVQFAAKKIQRHFLKYRAESFTSEKGVFLDRTKMKHIIRYSFIFMARMSQDVQHRKAKLVLEKTLQKTSMNYQFDMACNETYHHLSRMAAKSVTFIRIRRAQRELMTNYFEKEKKRIIHQLKLIGENSLLTGELLNILRMLQDTYRDQVLKEFDVCTQLNYFDELDAWRETVRDLRCQGYLDDRFNYRIGLHKDFRFVYNFKEVQYDLKICWQIDKVATISWDMCRKEYKHFLIKKKKVLKQVSMKSMANLMLKRKKTLRGINMDVFLTQVDTIEDENESQNQERERIKDLMNQKLMNPDKFAHFPDQPARKYIPTPEMMHKLIFKAIELEFGVAKIEEVLGNDSVKLDAEALKAKEVEGQIEIN